jgi:hypothetical protein
MTRLPTLQELRQAAKENNAAFKVEAARLADEFAMTVRVKIVAKADQIVLHQPVFVQWSTPTVYLEEVLTIINRREPLYRLYIGEETQQMVAVMVILR